MSQPGVQENSPTDPTDYPSPSPYMYPSLADQPSPYYLPQPLLPDNANDTGAPPVYPYIPGAQPVGPDYGCQPAYPYPASGYGDPSPQIVIVGPSSHDQLFRANPEGQALFHRYGVPSFNAFKAEIRPGCYDAWGRHERITRIGTLIEAEYSLTHENKALAFEMLNHFCKYGSTNCRNCGLGWGIYFVLGAIVEFVSMGSPASGTITLIVAVAFLLCWIIPYCRDRASQARLIKKEQDALALASATITP